MSMARGPATRSYMIPQVNAGVREQHSMTIRQVAWFLAAYIIIVALAIWFDLAVLCRGDAKFDGGCGGFGVYIPLWLIFLTPLPLAAILLERWRRSLPPPTSRLLAYLGGILALSQIGFLLIEKFPLLLAAEAVAIGVAAILRSRTIKHATSL
jgi:hypothetical protein